MRILMPLDRSAFSQQALGFVAARSRLMESAPDVELVHIQPPVPPRAARALGREIVEAHHEAEAAALLVSAAATLAAAGARATHGYQVGAVHAELARIVEAHAADLVVMASHGETGLTRLLFGSVTSMVAVTCSKPLLILRATPGSRESLRIALALDGSAHGLSLARFMASHHAFFGGKPEIFLLHVAPELSRLAVPGWIQREVETGIQPAQARAMQEAAFRSVFGPAREILRAAGLEGVEVRLVGSDPAEAIAAYANEARPDILALGSVGYGAHRFSSLGSVAARVAARTAASLLLGREPQGVQ